MLKGNCTFNVNLTTKEIQELSGRKWIKILECPYTVTQTHIQHHLLMCTSMKQSKLLLENNSCTPAVALSSQKLETKYNFPTFHLILCYKLIRVKKIVSLCLVLVYFWLQQKGKCLCFRIFPLDFFLFGSQWQSLIDPLYVRKSFNHLGANMTFYSSQYKSISQSCDQWPLIFRCYLSVNTWILDWQWRNCNPSS